METTYNGQGGGKPTIVGQRGLFKLITTYLQKGKGHTTLPYWQEGPTNKE